MRFGFRVLGISLAMMVVGCGGAAAPHERVTSTAAAVRAAEVGGAGANAQASLLLKRAREGLAQAKSLMDDGKNEEADFVLQRAEADADLALTLASEASAKAQAQAAVNQVKAFKQKPAE